MRFFMYDIKQTTEIIKYQDTFEWLSLEKKNIYYAFPDINEKFT